MKKCSKCLINKDSSLFYKDKSKKDQLSSYCKECRIKSSNQNRLDNIEYKTEYLKQYYIYNKETIREKHKQYYLENQDYFNEINKNWYHSNKEHSRIYKRKYKKIRRLTDNLFRISENLRGRLRLAFKAKSWKKNTEFSKYIGCSKEELILHIEKQFQFGMSWNNYATHWQIDHIKNLASAVTEQELYKLSHYTNLQPLFIEEHKEKTKKELGL